ncbi:MAG: DegV family protein, partial [Anaerotignum sp.]|nr:DegV family protein [Anaerotignum sp.]
MDFRVMSDSSCDISLEQEKAYDIRLVSYYVSFDGETYLKDREEITAEEFYQKMADNPGVYPKTSMPTQVDFYEAFLPAAQSGENIIYLNLTSKFSSSFQSANLAAEALMEEYPGCKIAVIDSFSATVQEGLLVTEAAKMAEAGLSFKEAVRKLEELKQTSRIFFTTGDLSYLQKGGRIGKVLTQAASMLKIKPIIHLYEGELQAAGIARARKKSIAKFMEDAKTFFADKNINEYRI